MQRYKASTTTKNINAYKILREKSVQVNNNEKQKIDSIDNKRRIKCVLIKKRRKKTHVTVYQQKKFSLLSLTRPFFTAK